MMALRSPNRSHNIPNTGCATPQARFWMAMARLNSDHGQLNWSAMGSWKTPKLALIAKDSIRMKQPAISTGLNRARDIAATWPTAPAASNADW